MTAIIKQELRSAVYTGAAGNDDIGLVHHARDTTG